MSKISVDVSSARIPVLQVGYQGENEVTDVLFDISSWITEFGEGVAQLRVKRPGNSEEESYVLSLTITDGIAVWTVSETDTFNKGNGKVQLSYMVGNIVKKAVIYPYKVGKSIVGADNPVDPFDSWIERSKAWATGETLDGDDVPETDETYQNNAKYYAEQADILGSAQVVLATEQVALATAKATLATEKADAAADSEANAAASEAAVNGVSTQLTTRMSAIETEQSVQSARIDTFTSLPEGSTSGNAELADIRVGADGTPYDTAGNAVRGQISELKSDLVKVEDATVIKEERTITSDITTETTYHSGYMNKTGEVSTSDNYKYTDKIPVKSGDIIATGSKSYNLRYVTAFSNNTPIESIGSDATDRYVVPEGVNYVVVTIYSAVGTTSDAILKTKTIYNFTNKHDEPIKYIEPLKNNVLANIHNPVKVSTTFTDGLVNKIGEIGTSSNYKYSLKIEVNEGDIITTKGWSYPFRYITAYKGDSVISEKSAETIFDYIVPNGVDSIIVTIYAVQSSIDGVITKVPNGNYTNILFGANAYKQVGAFEKAYICLSCDDGADELATYTIPMIEGKGVPCTFGLYKDSNVFLHGHTQIIVDAVNNYGCDVAQHGGQHSWTELSVNELVDFFNSEAVYWDRIGIEVNSAIYPTHLSNEMVRAITGSRYKCCRSGYNYDGILYYTDESEQFPYYATGARSNLYAMSSFNMPSGKDLNHAKRCIDWAIANKKLIHFYWHDWDLDDTAKSVLEATIDYAKTQNITFVKLSDIPKLT